MLENGVKNTIISVIWFIIIEIKYIIMNPIKYITKSNIRTTIFVSVFIVLIKLLFFQLNITFLTVNALLTAIISGTIFILGFLLNATLRDYKEAEKYPGDISSSLETMYDECEILYQSNKDPIVKEAIEQIRKINQMIIDWFYKKEYTQNVLFEISELNKYWGKFEPLTQANFIVRLKNEQNNLRKMMIRINILRDTPFYETSYKIARLSVIFLLIIFTLLDATAFYEYTFFIFIITFINIFLVNLIKDLDDPFEYDKDSSDEISIKPLYDFEKRLVKRFESA